MKHNRQIGWRLSSAGLLLFAIVTFSSVAVAQVPLSNTPTLVKTSEIDIKGCVPLFRQKIVIIKTRKQYLASLRKDAQTTQCLKDSSKIDLDEFDLFGLQINSGYCRRPLGLSHKLTVDEFAKKYVFIVNYKKPTGVCRALSRFDLWVLAPKRQKDFNIVFLIPV